MEINPSGKPSVRQLLKNFPTLHGSWRFIPVFILYIYDENIVTSYYVYMQNSKYEYYVYMQTFKYCENV
jgi:hypothetical protein